MACLWLSLKYAAIVTMVLGTSSCEYLPVIFFLFPRLLSIIAGLNILQVVNEPTIAAIAYKLKKTGYERNIIGRFESENL